MGEDLEGLEGGENTIKVNLNLKIVLYNKIYKKLLVVEYLLFYQDIMCVS